MGRKNSEKRQWTDPIILVPIITAVIASILAPTYLYFLNAGPTSSRQTEEPTADVISEPTEEPAPQPDIGRERELQSLVPLNLYYSNAREDNFLTATDVGARSAKEAGYEYVRIEGYIYPDQQSEGNLVPLKLYYSNAREDNFLTATDVGARSAKEAGYEYVRIEGYIYPDQQSEGNLVPLKLYYSNAREEFFTTATEEGISAADAGGYRLIGIEGFVYPNYFRFK
jgi:hypothetical protein